MYQCCKDKREIVNYFKLDENNNTYFDGFDYDEKLHIFGFKKQIFFHFW